MQWIVEPHESGQKLVNYIRAKLKDKYSGKQLKQSIENHCAKVNGRVERFASHTVATKDKISFHIPQENLIKSKASDFFSKASIIYEDDCLLVYNKPSGVASDSDIFLTTIKKYGKDWGLLHRLDKETTGLLMFTKDDLFRNQMVDLFKAHKIEKEYRAIVDGNPSKMSGKIDNYLSKQVAPEGQTLWGSTKKENGLHAVTSWEVLKRGKNASLVACYPKTGRTHQIRVHMSEMDHPICGDKQYGTKIKNNTIIKRCLLHAYKLRFIHPKKGSIVEFMAPLPDDFNQAIKDL